MQPIFFLFAVILQVPIILGLTNVQAGDDTLERLLRTQAFNRAFEGFDFYHVVIENDFVQDDGSHEVVAIASGKFLNNTKRLKVLFLIVDNRIIGGQVLEGTELPPCRTPPHGSLSSS